MLTDVHLTGPVHAVNGVVLTFNETLDPTSAQDPQAFLFGKPTPQNNSSSGVSIGDILGFLSRPKARLVKLGKIQWSSVSYDGANNTVTLTPIKAFNGQPFIRVLRVKGTGAHALKDPSGNILYDGQDGFIRWRAKTGDGKHIQYFDSDGDKVTLSLKGPGQLHLFMRTAGDPDPIVFVDNPKANSILSGKVQQAANGDGLAHINELLGAGGIQNNLLTNPQFMVHSTEG